MPDLRDWIRKVKEVGELREVFGADRDKDIGPITQTAEAMAAVGAEKLDALVPQLEGVTVKFSLTLGAGDPEDLRHKDDLTFWATDRRSPEGQNPRGGFCPTPLWVLPAGRRRASAPAAWHR